MRSETAIETVCDQCGVAVPHRGQLDINPTRFRLRLDVHACSIGQTPTATSIVVLLDLALKDLAACESCERFEPFLAGAMKKIQTAIERAKGVRG